MTKIFLITGFLGSGKTTFLNILSGCLMAEEVKKEEKSE